MGNPRYLLPRRPTGVARDDFLLETCDTLSLEIGDTFFPDARDDFPLDIGDTFFPDARTTSPSKSAIPSPPTPVTTSPSKHAIPPPSPTMSPQLRTTPAIPPPNKYKRFAVLSLLRMFKENNLKHMERLYLTDPEIRKISDSVNILADHESGSDPRFDDRDALASTNDTRDDLTSHESDDVLAATHDTRDDSMVITMCLSVSHMHVACSTHGTTSNRPVATTRYHCGPPTTTTS